VLELPVLAQATVATAVANVSARTFSIAFIVFTSSTALMCNACTEAFLYCDNDPERQNQLV
jgi:hypothetical protein